MKKCLIILTVIAVSVSTIILLRSFVKKPKFVEIKTPYLKTIYSISENREIELDGKIGKIKIEIKDMKVRVKESSCPNKICVKTGWISRSGEIIVCAPNEVTIRILSSNKGF